MTTTPRTADNIAYVPELGEVTALYIPNPVLARDPRGTWRRCQADIAWWRANNIEVLGAIVRDGRAWHWEGAPELDPFPDEEPRTRKEAMPGLRQAAERSLHHNPT